MNIFARIMLFLWVPLTVYLFKKKDARVAVLLSYIGGVLLLPPGRTIDLPIINYDKNIAIAIGILLGEVISQKSRRQKLSFIDYVLILNCVICPILTSVLNGFGFYEGFTIAVNSFLQVGVPFIVGRKYFKSQKDIELLLYSLLIGVLIYTIPTLYESRMSPQICIKVYGYFPHSWIQHFRYGGYRPIVFMNHGLMLSFWIAIGSVILFWEWRSKKIRKLFNIPVFILFGLNFATLALCNSKGALALGIIGISLWYTYKTNNSNKFFFISLSFFPVYFIMRILNIITIDEIAEFISHFFDVERIESLVYRLSSEEVLISYMGKRVLFGWHHWARGLMASNIPIIYAVDSLWIIAYTSRGLIGLVSAFTVILSGPFSVYKGLRLKYKMSLESILIGWIIILWSFDCITNSMVNGVFFLCSGALVSYFKLYKQSIMKNKIKS